MYRLLASYCVILAACVLCARNSEEDLISSFDVLTNTNKISSTDDAAINLKVMKFLSHWSSPKDFYLKNNNIFSKNLFGEHKINYLDPEAYNHQEQKLVKQPHSKRDDSAYKYYGNGYMGFATTSEIPAVDTYA